MPQDARTLGSLAVQLASEGRWREALQAAHACLRMAEPDSVLYLWALHMLACTYVDAGLPRRARPYARAYLRQAAAHPQLEPYTPYVVRAMGHIAYQERRFHDAFRWFRKAHTLFCRLENSVQAVVTSHNMAWALIRAGRPQRARAVLSPREAFPVELAYLFDGAMAGVLIAEGRLNDAIQFGRAALSAPGRRTHDFVDAAEVALLLASAYQRLQQDGAASALISYAAGFAALQEWELLDILLLSERAGGGDPPERAASSRGSANLLHRGCFTTGVA